MARSLAGVLAFSLALAACVSAPPIPPTPLARYQAVIARQGGCATFGTIDVARLEPGAWTSVPPNLAFHQTLRAANNASAPPETGARILIGWSGGHHEAVSGSLALVRQTDGGWRADGLTTYRSHVPSPPSAPPRETEVKRPAWSLSPDDAKALDAMIADPCLEAEPRNIILYSQPYLLDGGKAFCVGGAITTLEVFERDRRLVSTQHCGSWGVAGQIVDLAFKGAPKT
jgi:hypothetical protein